MKRLAIYVLSCLLLGAFTKSPAQTVNITEYPVPGNSGPAANFQLWAITAGPDGALWFTETNCSCIGRITTAGAITEYAAQGLSAMTFALNPYGITAGPDGALWFTDNSGRIGRMTTTGAVTNAYPVLAVDSSSLLGITVGPDGALWFTGGINVGRITTAGVVTQYAVPPATGVLQGITAGPDGALWFTGGNNIGRITTSGVITEYTTPTANSLPYYITAGPDGALWFTEYNGNKIGRITTAGLITEYAVPTQGSAPVGITAGPDGALWFTEENTNKIGRITTVGLITEYAVTAGSAGPSVGAPDDPNYITTGPDGALWFTDVFFGVLRASISGGNAITVTTNPPGLSVVVDGGQPALAPQFLNCTPGSPHTISTTSPQTASTGVVYGFANWSDGGGQTHSITCPAVATTYTANFNVISVPFTVSPNTLSFSLIAGSSSSQQISLSSPGAGLAWSASTSASWITLTPTSGTAPATINVTINTASLQPGAYTANITISNPLASPTQETINVSLTVTAATVTISVAPATLNFQIPQGAPAQSQTLQIGGTAGTAWQATAAASTGGAWLSVSPGAGQIPASLTALINSVSLTRGTYQGDITIQAPGATPSSSMISVTLTVTAASGQGGIITTVAGNGVNGFSGDGGPATSAEFNLPEGVAVDASGNLFIADFGNNRIREVSASGIITTVAGNGSQGFSGDGGLATSASLNQPTDVAVDASGNLFIADDYNNRIRKVSASGIVTTVAGNGAQGFSGDGGPATSAELYYPNGVAVDASGNLFIAEGGNDRIRKVSASGIITTVAGNGTYGFSGDGGPATSASLYVPIDVAVDASENLFIADFDNLRIRKVSASGIITTVVGNGTQGFSGDGGPATSAELYHPTGAVVDVSGNLFIADTYNNRIRKVSASGIITTVAGDGIQGFSGDGGPATSAELNQPGRLAVDVSGNLFIPDGNRIREVSASASTNATPTLKPGSLANGATYIAGGLVPGSWAQVKGTGLSNVTRNWSASDFVGLGNNLPTNLSGVEVNVNSVPAAVYYVAPDQVSFQVPAGVSGTASVEVINNGAASNAVTAATANNAPGIFPVIVNGTNYPAGVFLDGDYVGDPSIGSNFRNAKPGDVIQLFATGLVLTPAGVLPVAQGVTGVTVSVGSITVPAAFAGLVTVGEFQINFTVPQQFASLAAGLYPITISVNGVSSPVTIDTNPPGQLVIPIQP